MSKYEVTRDFVLRNYTFRKGDKVEVVGGDKVILDGEQHEFPSVIACLNKGWLAPVKKATAAPEKQTSSDKPKITDMPTDWAGMHWMKRKTWVDSCDNPGLLHALRKSESERMQTHIDVRLKVLVPQMGQPQEKTEKPKAMSLKRPAGGTVEFPENKDVPAGGLVLDM